MSARVAWARIAAAVDAHRAAKGKHHEDEADDGELLVLRHKPARVDDRAPELARDVEADGAGEDEEALKDDGDKKTK